MRSSLRVCVALALFGVILPTVSAVENLFVVTPTQFAESVAGVNNRLIEKPALFGKPPYRVTLYGQAVYATPNTGCAPLNNSDPIWQSSSVFAVLDRGDCSFVTKVRNAQLAGAKAALIADNKNENPMPLMGDDGTGSNVEIPSVLVDYTQANKMKTWLLANSGVPNTVSLTYNLPNPDGRVEWDLFTSSIDPQTAAFKEAMIPVVKNFDKMQFFTPHYYLLDGTVVGCAGAYERCGNLCLNNGRYCMQDPDRNIGQGLSGADVLYEDIRQLCVWQYLNQTYGEGHNQYLLFQYMVAQNTVCYNSSNPDLWRNGDCQWQQLENLKIPRAAIQDCMTASNVTQSDGQVINTLLDQMLADKAKFQQYFFPAAFVNLERYVSDWCSPPVTNTNCYFASTICSGFDDNDIPDVCRNKDPCPFGTSLDCSLTCGNKSVSPCGFCMEQSDPKFYQPCENSSSSSLATGAIVGIVFASLFVVALVGGGVYFYMQYQSRKMREDIDSLLKQYLPLEGGINNGSQQKNGRLVDTASEHDL